MHCPYSTFFTRQQIIESPVGVLNKYQVYQMRQDSCGARLIANFPTQNLPCFFCAYLLTDFPDAQKLRVVQDNYTTHSPASLYKAFDPEEAHRILNRLEFCHTPKHGSWLNMAEIELSVLGRQCLDRRIPDTETLQKEIEAWQENRNHEETWIDWRFTTADARVKLRRLYPSINT